jgi:uncharacterized protein (TIGR00251 family)
VTLEVRELPDGVIIRVRAAAGASRRGITGVHDGAVKVAVTTAPEKGRANQAILSVLAAALDVSPRDLAMVAGATGRDKQVLVRGIAAAELRRRLARDDVD